MKRPFRLECCVCVACCTGAIALLAQVESVQAQEPPSPAHQTKFADAGGVRLHYIDFGGEGLPVILVPAVTRDATHYEPLGPLLTAQNRVLAVTRRGDGQSEDPGGNYDAQTQARDFLHFMDALEIPQAVFVSNVGDEITYLAEAHPHRVAGLVFLGGPARGATGEVLRTEPTGMAEALRRLWQSAVGLPPDYFGYVPRYLQSDAPTIDAPALVFVTTDGMRGVERENPALMMVGSPLTADMVRGLRPEDGRAHFERLADDPQYRDRTLEAIPDSVARSYFQRLAADAELQAQVQRFQEEALIPAEIGHWSAFRRAFAGRLELVQLDVPAVSGYEYNSAPELIAPHIRRFLEDMRPAGGADTVHVAPPTGERDADRASILAAVERVGPGGTVQFAPGTYLVGPMVQVTVPRVTLLGHPEGTTLRGCDPEGVDGRPTWMEVCNGLELAGARQTVRGFTFEHAFWALHLGCCFDERTSYDFPDGSTHELPVIRRGEGGHRVEGNTFRSASSGIRVNGGWTEPSIVRGNRFIDNWHAVSINGHTVHVLDNHFSVPQPERVPDFGYAWDAIKIAPPPMSIQGDTAPPACVGNVIAGNTIEGYVDGVRLEVYLPGSICRENVIRDNTITVRRAHNPSGVHFRDGGDPSDSTVIGVPIALLNDPIFSEYAGSDAPTFVEENTVEGNRILGAEGIGIEVFRASRNRIANNVIERVVAREPFPGNTMTGAPDAWREANGSAIWLSPGSNENEIIGNTFADIGAHAVVLEGDGNIVETRSVGDGVRDLGSDNRVGTGTAAQDAGEPTHESRFVRVDGERLQFLDFGGDGLPVLFTAGARPAETWTGFAPRFADRHRVIAITHRGVPPSEGQETGYVQSARDILALLDSLGFERAFLVGNSNPAPVLIYIAEHHPERVAGFVFLAPASEAGFESVQDPSGAMQMVERAFLSTQGRNPDEAGGLNEDHLYRPRYLESGKPGISIPALTFVNRDGTRGLERLTYPLQVAEMVAAGNLQIPDSVARTYFERLAVNADMQQEVQAAWDTVFAAAMTANEQAFFRAFGESLRIVRLDVPLMDGVPVVTGYEYRDSPNLIEADIRQFLAEVTSREATR